MSSLGEENNVQCQFQRIENRNLGKEHFSINEQEIVSNYVKKDISQAGLYLQSFHPQCSSPSTPTTSTPCQSVPGNNFVASIHERPETSEASTCLLSNSYVPLPQLSDETLYTHIGNTDSESDSSGTENDAVPLTKRKFTRYPGK